VRSIDRTSRPPALDAAEHPEELKAEMYSEISMKFLDSGAIMHARALIDARARQGRRRGRLSDAAEISHYAFLSGGGRYFTYCVAAAAFGNFSRREGTAGNLARVCGHLNVVVAI